jgi:hypothetical protein
MKEINKMSDLQLYKIPTVDTSLPQDGGNPASVSSGASDVQTNTPSQNKGLSEQDVRDIVNSTRDANKMTEGRVREIVNGMQKFLTGQNIMVDGIQKSQNFYTGVSGWQIDAEGNAEFNNGTFRGTFQLGGTLITVSDIANLADAITTVSTAGGGTVSLVPGTYNATQSYSIPSGVVINGNGAVIDFGGGAYQFSAVGTNAYSTGTVSATYGSATITGSGTTFTSAMVGRYILIYDFWYEITAFTDTTHITIGQNFFEVSLTGRAYTIATTVDGIGLTNITIQNSSVALFRPRYVNGLDMTGLVTINGLVGVDMDDSANWTYNGVSDACGTGLTFDNAPFGTIEGLVSNVTSGGGLLLNGVRNTAMGPVSIQGIVGVGVSLTNCTNFGNVNFSIIKTSSHGIEFVSGNSGIDTVAGLIDSAGGDGIKLTATTDRCTITSIAIENNTGYGINIAASSCDDNQVISPAFLNNTSGDINDSGTNTTVLPQNNVQIFTADGTWTKPAGAKSVTVVCIGAGGGGAGPNHTLTSRGGSGGGGGASITRTFSASDLAGTVAVTVGAGGPGGTNANGTAGGVSNFGTHVYAYGGGGGYKLTTGTGSSGGGGGGSAGVGAVGAQATDVLGGLPASVAGAAGISGQGGGGDTSNVGTAAENGGGAGGGTVDGATDGRAGGDSLYGGGGGGAGGGNGTQNAGGAGGGIGYSSGNGGAGGAVATNGTAGASGVIGKGGGGGGGSNAGTGGTGGAGGAPGGGGGGGGCGATDGIGGAGGRGEVRVYTT